MMGGGDQREEVGPAVMIQNGTQKAVTKARPITGPLLSAGSVGGWRCEVTAEITA